MNDCSGVITTLSPACGRRFSAHHGRCFITGKKQYHLPYDTPWLMFAMRCKFRRCSVPTSGPALLGSWVALAVAVRLGGVCFPVVHAVCNTASLEGSLVDLLERQMDPFLTRSS